jgi:hypothetical protein
LKSIQGWLNTGRQKSKISPDAVESDKCPRCHEPNETRSQAHPEVPTCWCSQEMIWSCSPNAEEDPTKWSLSCTRDVHEVHQVLAWSNIWKLLYWMWAVYMQSWNSMRS